MADRTRIGALTGLRGVAALCVACYHLLLPGAFVTGMAARLLGRCYLSVDLFFVLSGFVLARTYGRRVGGASPLAGMADFIRRRLARIYPLYGLILLTRLGYTALRYHSFALPRPWIAAPAEHPWLSIPANLLLVQSWGVAPSLIGPGWSVSTEWAAYWAFPLLAMPMLRARAAVAMAGAAGAAALVVAAAHHGALDSWDGRTAGPLLRCFGGFTLGLGIWRLSEWAPAARMAAGSLAGWCVCVAAAAALGLGAPDLAVYPLLPALVLVLACGAGGPAGLLRAPAAIWLGEVSYAIYLLHIFLLHPLDQARAACRLALPPLVADALAASLILACLLAAAELAHRLVERPVRSWLEAGPARAACRRSSLTCQGAALRNLPPPAPRTARPRAG